MQVQELDDLAKWFKQNVLNSFELGANSGASILDHTSYNDDASEADTSFKNKAQNENRITKEHEDELSLLEYIIGVN